VGVIFELHVDGSPVTLPDPAGGTFNAAGDFDRLLPMFGDTASERNSPLNVLSRVDSEGCVVFDAPAMADVVGDVDLLAPRASVGPESRGLARLRVLAVRGAKIAHAELHAIGD